jgi:voltage-gated potassium channel
MDPDDKLISAFLLLGVLLFTGTVSYHGLEGWSVVDSLYFTAMTVTTVGYGDLVPTTDISKIFTVFFSLSGIGIVLVVLVNLGGRYYRREQRAFSKRIRIYVDRKKQQAEHERRVKAAKKAAETRRKRSGKRLQTATRRNFIDYFRRD